MNWFRVLLDGVMVSAVFNLGVGLCMLIRPAAFTDMYPRDIQRIAPKMTKADRRFEATMLLILYPVLIAWMVLSAQEAGIEGFWPLFWTTYVQMMLVNLGDFFGLDWYFREKMGHRLELPGTEGNELYSRRHWMRKLAIPEHWVMWPLLVCPLVSLLCAWLGGLF
ncbi:MAG: hypothetical protein IJ438_09570 [Clostridia bacterium]|nr:hypothetical protein [Clostridia bacterium]